MRDFKQLAGKYLAYNKKRTVLTILGVALSSMVLFVLINTIMSLYMTSRDELRKEMKYEAAFLFGSESEAERLAGESCIVDYKIVEGPEEEMSAGKEYVVYICFEQPYLMKGYVEKLTEKYQVKEWQPTPLGEFYYMEEGSFLLVMAVLTLLISYIFAVFGVAVVRNSIQLMTLEQIKDYGMLRCMGSTRKQLKEMVFKMGFILEISGIVVGVVLGFLVYLPIAIKAELQIGFHAIGVVFIILAFMFDLYFVMQENCKFVNKLTPIAAVRGEFKIKTEKIKARRKSLAGVLFGVEGDYAAKNLKRNPSRMWKSVGAMSMGIAMTIVTVSICGILYSYATEDTKQFGKYQLVDVAQWIPGLGQEYYKLVLLSEECSEELENNKMVTASKDVYEVMMYTADFMEILNHYTDEFLYQSDYGRLQRSGISVYEKKKDIHELTKRVYETTFAECSLVGYDEEDYANLESSLIEGTMDLSENGILLVNGTCTMVENAALNGIWQEYTMTDYKVGDTIEIVDYKKMNIWIKKRLRGVQMYEADGAVDYEVLWNLLYEGYYEMLNQGATKTYVIEGIVNRDENRNILYGGPRMVLPLERFFQETGLHMGNAAGKMYRIEGHRLDDSLKNLYEIIDENGYYEQYWYLEVLYHMQTIWNVVVGAACFVFFVVIVNMLNVINTTASDLHLRRKEFAQLRVLGMSKRKLTFTVLLEGLISAFLSGIFGVTFGYLIVYLAMDAINYAFYVEFHFSWWLCAGVVAISGLILCLTVYLPIRGMKLNVAEELLASGE